MAVRTGTCRGEGSCLLAQMISDCERRIASFSRGHDGASFAAGNAGQKNFGIKQIAGLLSLQHPPAGHKDRGKRAKPRTVECLYRFLLSVRWNTTGQRNSAMSSRLVRRFGTGRRRPGVLGRRHGGQACGNYPARSHCRLSPQMPSRLAGARQRQFRLRLSMVLVLMTTEETKRLRNTGTRHRRKQQPIIHIITPDHRWANS